MKGEQRPLALARGHRLRSARMLTGHSRKEFGEKLGISANTLTTWEAPREQISGLTGKGAKRVISGLRKLGIDCSYDWLYNGIGTGLSVPNYPDAASNPALDIPEPDWSDSIKIIREIEYFKQIYNNSVVVAVMDDGLEPRFSMGDYVGGHWYENNELLEAEGQHCIVETSEELTFTRLISSIDRDDKKCTSTCTNPFTKVSQPTIYNEKINRIAKIVWHRMV